MTPPDPRPPPPFFDFLRHLPRENILQDDGKHVLVTTMGLNGPQVVDGALLRRHAFSEVAPFGLECLGQYKRQHDGSWHATLYAASPAARSFKTELDALVNLWANRHEQDLETLF